MHILLTAFDIVPSPTETTTQLRYLIRSLRDAGHDVTLITAGDGTLSGEDQFEGARHFRTPSNTNRTFQEQAADFSDAVLAHLGQSDQYDIVHTRSVWDGTALVRRRDTGRGAAGRRRFKLVYDVHSLAHLDLPVTRPSALNATAVTETKAQEADLLRLADAVFCESRAGRIYLQELGVQPRRVTILPNGVDPELFPAVEWKSPGANPTLLYIGSFETWSGLDVVLRAMPLVQASHKVRLRLIGTGSKAATDALQKQVKDLKLGKQVSIEDALPYESWPDAIASAAICLAPQALDDRNVLQGLGSLSLSAYMASARPIVGTDLPAMREFLRPGVDGLLVYPDSPENLASAVVRLLDDDRLARQLAASAARYARSHYTWAELNAEVIKVYETLAAATRSRRR